MSCIHPVCSPGCRFVWHFSNSVESGVPIIYEVGLPSLITGACPRDSQRFGRFGLACAEKPDKIMTGAVLEIPDHQAKALIYQ